MGQNIVKLSLKASGISCVSCVRNLESHLKTLDGVNETTTTNTNEVYLEYDPSIISLEYIQKKAKKIGYTLSENNKPDLEFSKQKHPSHIKSKLITSSIFSIPIFTIDMFFKKQLYYENWLMLTLSLPVIFWSGSEFFINAWKKIKCFKANMDTLVALSTGSAFGFSLLNTIYPDYFLQKGIEPFVYYESSVVTITLILVGRYLENQAKWKTSSAIRSLIKLKPQQVTILRNQESITIPVDNVKLNDFIILKPGEKIPVDGLVESGHSYVDESMISGESIPIEKNKNDKVLSGTINQKGSLIIRAKKIGNETLLSQIINQVKKAQSSKPPIQKLADKISSIFVPTVLSIALITFFIWYQIDPKLYINHAFLTFITVLIISCPCALGLATPTALAVGIGKGAKRGIFIKDAQALEKAYKVNTLVLDKTGTLTKGTPSVTDIFWEDNKDISLLKEILLSIETQSEHPLAGAITKHLKKESTSKIPIENFESITGKGAKATYKNCIYLVGNSLLMSDYKINIPNTLSSKADELSLEAKTVVFFSSGDKVAGIIGISDQLRDGVDSVIKHLKKVGIEIYMLTGDNKNTAHATAKKLGINHYHVNMLPHEKGEFIKTLQKEGRTVAMAGDGINDALALTQSDVGIAMGSGTDIAMESAGITLMNSDLRQISNAITLSKYTMQTVYQNFFWAFAYNIIAIPVAAGALYPFWGILLNPMIASAAMGMSDISVLANSLRFKNKKLTLKS